MKYHTITIEREYASGGREIGERLAKRLGIPCYGAEILEMAAQIMGTTPEELIHLEERATGSTLYAIAMMDKIITGERSGLSSESALYLAEARVIHDLASRGDCILVGHCAGWVLREKKDILNVFVHSRRDTRKERAVCVYGEDKNRVDSILRRYDKRRSNYFRASSGQRWDDIDNYHLMLNSSCLGIEGCVETIEAAVR